MRLGDCVIEYLIPHGYVELRRCPHVVLVRPLLDRCTQLDRRSGQLRIVGKRNDYAIDNCGVVLVHGETNDRVVQETSERDRGLEGPVLQREREGAWCCLA